MQSFQTPQVVEPNELIGSGRHAFEFQNGGAVEFASQMKALREESGFQIRLLRVIGQFPTNAPEVIALIVETADTEISSNDLRDKILSHVSAVKNKGR